jgi:MFS family permease
MSLGRKIVENRSGRILLGPSSETQCTERRPYHRTVGSIVRTEYHRRLSGRGTSRSWRKSLKFHRDVPPLKDYLSHGALGSVTLRIVHTFLFNFLCYLIIGLLLAVLPGFVHVRLGLSPFWAGFVVSSQYAATLVSRPNVGRMTDVLGPKTTVLLGQVACLFSAIVLLLALPLEHGAITCLVVLLISRLILGCAESGVATGSTTWGLARVEPRYAARVISWSGIASYGAMGIGAPIGIWLEKRVGFGAVGTSVFVISILWPFAACSTKC